MELRDYLRIMRRRWLLITSTVLVAVVAAALVTFNMTPQYASTAGLFVSTTRADSGEAYQGGLFSQQRITSYAELATGQELARRVIAEEDLDLTPQELSQKVEATVVPETVTMDITVTDPSPQRARLLAAAVASELTQFVDELETPPGRQLAPIKVSVVDQATLPTEPVSPQPLRNLGLAAVLGLLLGLGLAVLRELLDTSVKSADDIRALSDAPVMADIAFDPRAAKQPLLSQLEPHAPRVEAFRVLRTNLQFVDVDNPSKAFVVTSSLSGEGKTSTATNLAIALAQAGQNVLLVDGDLRRPQVAGVLGLEQQVGLTTVLIGSIGFEEALQPSEHEGLTVLTSGAVPPNPAELLQSRAMAEVTERARKQFDVIVVDGPPLLPVTDGALLAAHVDGALLVVRHSRTTRDQLRHSFERLEGVGARTLGVVFNMVPSRGRGGESYGYGYGYGYGPEQTAKGKRRA